MFLVCNMARPSARAPLKQWKWLTVVSPPAPRHTWLRAHGWHRYKHPSQEPNHLIISWSIIQYTTASLHHLSNPGNLPELFCPNLRFWHLESQRHELFISFSSVSSDPSCLTHSGLAANADILLSISTKPGEFGKMFWKWSQAKSNRR